MKLLENNNEHFDEYIHIDFSEGEYLLEIKIFSN